MTTYTLNFTGYLARAARALIELSADHIAAESDMTIDELRSFERGTSSLPADQIDTLKSVLEQHGAVFLPDGEEAFGYGVRLKFSRVGSKRIDTWEGEGGPAAEDDV